MRTLGIIGGTSWHSTVEYYRYINESVNAAYGNETNPPLVVYNLNQFEIHALQEAGRWDAIGAMYCAAATRLCAAGCEGLLLAANTAHKVFDQIEERVGPKILHIGDATGHAIRHTKLNIVGLIGTRFTMEHEFLRAWLLDRYGINTITPPTCAARGRIQEMIQNEFSRGLFTAASKRFLQRQIEILRDSGASGIVLGCTELPLVIRESDVELPLFDTTKLHAQMAVEFILERSTF